MKAYDLLFGDHPDALATAPDESGRQVQAHHPVRAGWSGGWSPGIDPVAWPRSPQTGLPMAHILTVRLPELYQRKGPELPGVAFYAGEGQFAEELEPDPHDPFVAQREQATTHPNFRLLIDLIGGAWGLLWLSSDELNTRTPPPEDVRRPGEHPGAADECVNAWDDPSPEVGLWLSERPDPNAGITPSENDDTDYQLPWQPNGDWKNWARPLAGRSHLGGTTFYVQELPDGLSPFYLELEAFGVLNFGDGGTAQVDLDSDVFDWACG